MGAMARKYRLSYMETGLMANGKELRFFCLLGYHFEESVEVCSDGGKEAEYPCKRKRNLFISITQKRNKKDISMAEGDRYIQLRQQL